MKTKRIPGFALCAAMTLLAAPALYADWSFVMLGDTRGPHHTTTGVSPVLNAIATKIAALNPDLVLVAGDLINGDDTNGLTALTYAQQCDNWKAAMQPVFNYSTSTGIPIYTVRGNHENNCDEGPPILDLKQAYADAFGARMPTNGPNNGPADDQRGFSYSFTYNNATFVVADQYFYHDQTTNLTGYHSLDRAWVTQQFQQATSPYKVFMAHVPIFMTEGQNEPEHFFGTNAAGYQVRADFWNALGSNGVQLYVTGHLHNETVAGATNDYGNTIIQVLAGNGGAPLDPVVVDPDPGVEILYTNGLYGFSLATVRADSMTIQYYSLNTNDNSWTVDGYRTMMSPSVIPGPMAHAGWAVGFSQNGYAAILRSTDSGKTWCRQGANQLENVGLDSVCAVDPYTAWVVGEVIGGYAAIYHTRDGGGTWTRMGSAANVPATGLTKVYAVNDSNVWAVGQGTILHTVDGGATWTNRIPAGYESTALQGVFALDATQVWVTGAVSTDGFATILHSRDAGGSWTRQGAGGAATNANHLLGISATDARTAWTVGGTGNGYIALRTTDGGATWNWQTNVTGTWDGNEVCALGAGVVWAACDGMIYRTTDGGTNWAGSSAGYYTVGMSAVSDMEAWATRSSFNGTIYHTSDGGTNWTALNQLGAVTLPGLSAISFARRGIPELEIKGGGSFGVRTNQFGFTVTGTSNLFVIVDACTNLIQPAWFPVGTGTLTGGSFKFSDPRWTNHPANFYRPRAP